MVYGQRCYDCGKINCQCAIKASSRTYNRVNRQLCNILGVDGQAIGGNTPSETFAILADILRARL